MRLLDLFCGAGGCAVGYHRAGFTEIVGVDIKPQPRYPFAFVQGDALEYLREHGREFDAIHASPPCKRFTSANRANPGKAAEHRDQLTPCRVLLQSLGVPWVIENVVGAPMLAPAMVCGLSLGLAVKRHRLFESSVPLVGTTCPKGHPGEWVTVMGGGAPVNPGGRRRAGADRAKAAMGIDWMSRDELSQAIPPAYTEFIGRQLLAAIHDARSTSEAA